MRLNLLPSLGSGSSITWRAAQSRWFSEEAAWLLLESHSISFQSLMSPERTFNNLVLKSWALIIPMGNAFAPEESG